MSSPTFTIVNEHHANGKNIYHFDVYRLEDSDEFYAIGGEEYFKNGICLIEWGQIIQDVLPKEYIQIDFKKSEEDEDTRILTITTYGDKYIHLLK
ncbi:MAG: tRNA (adenosine(37)-N6)-threonylcarbamoyltransferase complex ATPase subunit type 1 TsaE [Clostridia bacterium]